MNEGRTSIILFTNNPNIDQDRNYFKAFEEVAIRNFGQEEDPILFVTSGVSYGI